MKSVLFVALIGLLGGGVAVVYAMNIEQGELVDYRIEQGEVEIESAHYVVVTDEGERKEISRSAFPDIAYEGAADSTCVYTEGETYGMASVDTDGDNLPDLYEIDIFGTDPEDSDSDNDGFSDLTELMWGYNPTALGTSIDQDQDGDLLSDASEVLWGTSVTDPDFDDDGYEDGTETRHNYSPLGRADTDEYGPVDSMIQIAYYRAVLEDECPELSHLNEDHNPAIAAYEALTATVE